MSHLGAITCGCCRAGSGTLPARALPPAMPTALLMGCSSARLRAGAHGGGAATGAPASYLAAGSACVVGNLWDVTDRDIDRFTADLLARCASASSITAPPRCALVSSRTRPPLEHFISLGLFIGSALRMQGAGTQTCSAAQSYMLCRCLPVDGKAMPAARTTSGSASAVSYLADGLANTLQLTTPMHPPPAAVNPTPATPALQRRGRMLCMQAVGTPPPEAGCTPYATAAVQAPRPARRRGGLGNTVATAAAAASASDDEGQEDANTAVTSGLLMEPPRLGAAVNQSGSYEARSRRPVRAAALGRQKCGRERRTVGTKKAVPQASQTSEQAALVATANGTDVATETHLENVENCSGMANTSTLGPTVSRRHLVSACVNASRGSCKLRYLNGAAPVVYGVPTWFVSGSTEGPEQSCAKSCD
jgi:Peptidase family C50